MGQHGGNLGMPLNQAAQRHERLKLMCKLPRGSKRIKQNMSANSPSRPAAARVQELQII